MTNKLICLRLSLLEILIASATLIASHLFFVLRERLFAILLLIVVFTLFHFFGKSEFKKFTTLIAVFLGSFWMLEIKYPFIGPLFWPIDQFIGALLIFIFAKTFKFQGTPMSWSLRFTRPMLLSVVGIVLPSLICLGLYFFTHKEIADKWPLPAMSIWATPFVVILIALINGIREEFYFRFTLQNYLLSTNLRNLAVVCSSIVFGYMHYQDGFPSGGAGVFLSALFGLLIGIQFFYFKSATLSWLTHSLTDAVMFAIILFNRRVM